MGRPDFSYAEVGPYLLTRFLGAGSAGSVYRAVDVASKDPQPFCAVKCLPRARISRERGVQLVAEILYLEATARCPNVLTLRDIIDNGRYVFLVFDLCDTDMCQAITNKVYWKNDARIKQAFIQILDAVSACHERRIFHRDLKPDNIMCNSDGSAIRVGDFGWATHHRVSLDGGCGTPSYMSPESWMSLAGDPYQSAPADIWSLGVILFTMVTTRNPWDAALSSDKEFSAFIDDEDHLFHTSPISGPLNVLLKWIMHPIPTMRLSIPVIRQAVLEIRTFYKRSPAAPKEASYTDTRKACVKCANGKHDHAVVSTYAPKYRSF